MPTQQDIDRFTLAFHQRAIECLRQEQDLQLKALEVLDRWETRGMSDGSRIYRNEWRTLLLGDLNRLEQAVCGPTDHAATLRNMSPLGFVLSDDERLRIRRTAMAK
ncbi:MAG: hypothetical protein V4636_21510 [Pseudomonadota bacterium]|jgi:hypothetical protein